MIRLSFDSKGFPMGKVSDIGAFHLWPVTRFQFKQFMEETGLYDSKWYDSLNYSPPFLGFDDCNETNYEQLFMTGILPKEAQAFARWLGDGYDIPTDAEWTEFYKAVKSYRLMFRLSPYGNAPEAGAFSKKLHKIMKDPLCYTFMNRGLVEWVKTADKFAGRGAPRESFFPNAWNPANDSIRIINTDERIFYFGFRLIKRIFNVHEFSISGGRDDIY